ncbi:MAG: histidine kinase [Polaromonas sp.]|nr:histidine kinase [Polaromonas sp.]
MHNLPHTAIDPVHRPHGFRLILSYDRHLIVRRTDIGSPTDQNRHEFKLSPTSRKMLELKDEVFAEWGERVRHGIQEAKLLTHPILMNTLPSLYDDMAESLTPKYRSPDAVSATAIAIEHGGERARLTNYGPKEIVFECQLLRTALLDVMNINGIAFKKDELQGIDAFMEEAIREAVSGHGVAVAAMREQVMLALMHDIRNPLAAASANAELIVRTADSPAINESAARIFTNIRRVDEMVHALLDFMVFQRGGRLQLDLCKFDILELVREVCVQAEAAHGQSFKIIGKSTEVFWCYEQVRRALENLIGNAMKYGAPNTPISITLDCLKEMLSLSVHNVGNPIPFHETNNIFHLFQRAQAAMTGKKEGWGIGLPFIRAVAESHGGTVVVDNSVASGTTFLIDMPLDARPSQPARILG